MAELSLIISAVGGGSLRKKRSLLLRTGFHIVNSNDCTTNGVQNNLYRFVSCEYIEEEAQSHCGTGYFWGWRGE